MIHADQLSKEFGRFQAVKNASFQIEKGEIVGFLGRTAQARPQLYAC